LIFIHASRKRQGEGYDKFYSRTADIIYPPVHTGKFKVRPKNEIGEFYLCLSRLVPYKRIDIAVEAFRKLDLPLIIAGDGVQINYLKKIAGPKTKFLGWIDEAEKIELLESCRALVFPGVEDFGIVPVEAQAAGRPVIALGEGGATETVIPEQTGVFFEHQSAESLLDAVERFQRLDFDPAIIANSAKRFDTAVFRENFKLWVEKRFSEFSRKIQEGK